MGAQDIATGIGLPNYSPTEITVIDLILNSYERGQFTLISIRLIWYSCSHISGHHEPIHVKFSVRGLYIMFYWNIVLKMLKYKEENLMHHTLVLYSVV